MKKRKPLFRIGKKVVLIAEVEPKPVFIVIKHNEYDENFGYLTTILNLKTKEEQTVFENVLETKSVKKKTEKEFKPRHAGKLKHTPKSRGKIKEDKPEPKRHKSHLFHKDWL